MSFKDLNLKKTRSYSSERDNLVNDFYIPVLKKSKNYKRIAGYFSSSSFVIAAKGFSDFIKNKGHSQFIINVVLQSDDIEQIQKGYTTPEKIIENKFLADLNRIEDEFRKNHAKVLGWLIAKGLMEIRVGVIEEKTSGNEILHQKMGIFEDNEGNVITFVGSNNESISGWQYNSEKFKIFFNWEDQYKLSILEDTEEFDELWNNRAKKTKVYLFPEAVKQDLIKRAPANETELLKIIKQLENDEQDKTGIRLRPYQIKAVDSWFNNNCIGIFEMATGTGKTITAIEAMKKLFERESKLIVVICCPYLHLINQWHEALSQMKIECPIIEAHGNNQSWKTEFVHQKFQLELNRQNHVIIITTHDTFSSESFIEIIENRIISPLFLIADEVHGLGATNRSKALLKKYTFRLGLSATPSRFYDIIGTKKLFDFFNKIVFEFDLHRALTEIDPETKDTYLVPYFYFPHFVELTPDEMVDYEQSTKIIARLYFKTDRTEEEDRQLEYQILKRQEKLKNAENKMAEFEKIIYNLEKEGDISHTLVYCSPQQLDNAQIILRKWEGKIIQHKFTFEEKKEDRKVLLNHFDIGDTDVLVAMKCLDEGLDVPSTKNAILLCSSGNPREYIQRRGRVLRRFHGKEYAKIFDIAAIPSKKYRIEVTNERKILEKEIRRLSEFAEAAKNEKEVKEIIDNILIQY
jgi:superfamily II DNA or RNA helicase